MPRLAALLALVLAAALGAAACVPVVVGAAAGGAAIVASSRRTTAVQMDDSSVESKLADAVATRYGERVHVSVASYRGQVLLTGEVPDEATSAAIAAMAKETDRVRTVVNELVVAPVAGVQARAHDAYLTSAVKARLFDADQSLSVVVTVVTERDVVYLMGLVSRAEGEAAARVAATTDGVQRVVKLFEYTD